MSATASAPRSRPAAYIYEIDLPLAGDFQISNALVAAGLAIATGTPAAQGAWRRWKS